MIKYKEKEFKKSYDLEFEIPNAVKHPNIIKMNDQIVNNNIQVFVISI